MTTGELPQRSSLRRRRFPIRPTTGLGRWAVGLAVAHVVLSFSWQLLGRLGGIPGLVLGLVAGVVALVAIVRRGERAVSVLVAVAPLVLVVAFVLAELLIGHE